MFFELYFSEYLEYMCLDFCFLSCLCIQKTVFIEEEKLMPSKTCSKYNCILNTQIRLLILDLVSYVACTPV